MFHLNLKGSIIKIQDNEHEIMLTITWSIAILANTPMGAGRFTNTSRNAYHFLNVGPCIKNTKAHYIPLPIQSRTTASKKQQKVR